MSEPVGRGEFLQLRGQCNKHQTDLYMGNGKPALTVRMALMEECLAKLSKNMSRGIWLLVLIFLTALADIFVKRF